MRQIKKLPLGRFALLAAFMASTAQAIAVDQQLPPVIVTSPRIERLGIQIRNEPSITRVLLWYTPTKKDVRKLLVRGGQVGDEIIAINGHEVAKMKRREWSKELSGYFKLVVKRQTGRDSFVLVDADGRGD